MRGFRICLIAAVALGVAAVSGAAGPMALTQTGDLYMVGIRDNQVVITARYADGTVEELLIPQSAAAVDSSLQVGVDETTGALYVLWQKKDEMEARLRLATFVDGTWIGPRTFAGGDGTAALNPVMLIHRAVSIVEDGTDENGDPIVTELATTFLHLAWWSQYSEDDSGLAMYAAVEIIDGVPQFNQMEPIELQGLFPFGIACFEFEANENLRHPKLFIEPKSNNPHVFATDLGDCFFQILEIVPVVEEQQEEPDFAKRRRQIIILRKASMIALRPELPLAKGKLVIGSGLRVLMHWDGDSADNVHYLELDPDGLHETKTLVLDDHIDHERAVELIRELAER